LPEFVEDCYCLLSDISQHLFQSIRNQYEQYWLKQLMCKNVYAVCLYSGNYPPPPTKYSSDLRCLIAELFRRNPRYDFDTFSVIISHFNYS